MRVADKLLFVRRYCRCYLYQDDMRVAVSWVSVVLLSLYVCAADNFVIAKCILPAAPVYNILSIYAATLESLFGLNVENAKW